MSRSGFEPLKSDTQAESRDRMASKIGKYQLNLDTAADLDPIVQQAKQKKVVILGGSECGSLEVDIWRTKLCLRLLEEGQFDFVVMDSGWGSIQTLRSDPNTSQTTTGLDFQPWETWGEWRWATPELSRFYQRLEDFNRILQPSARIGLYGLDLYSKWRILTRLKTEGLLWSTQDLSSGTPKWLASFFAPLENSDKSAEILTDQYMEDQLGLWGKSMLEFESTTDQNLLQQLHGRMLNKFELGAGRYYANFLGGGINGFNLRTRQLQETFQTISQAYGQRGRGIIWTDNLQACQIRATSLRDEGIWSLYQLLEDIYGQQQVYNLGFSLGGGRVLQDSLQVSKPVIQELPQPAKDSWESLCGGSQGQSRMVITHFFRKDWDFKKYTQQRLLGCLDHSNAWATDSQLPAMSFGQQVALAYQAMIHIPVSRPAADFSESSQARQSQTTLAKLSPRATHFVPDQTSTAK